MAPPYKVRAIIRGACGARGAFQRAVGDAGAPTGCVSGRMYKDGRRREGTPPYGVCAVMRDGAV